MAHTPSELDDVLSDLRRHLAWQEGDAGSTLLSSVEALKAAASALRNEPVAPPKAAAPAMRDPVVPQKRADVEPPRVAPPEKPRPAEPARPVMTLREAFGRPLAADAAPRPATPRAEPRPAAARGRAQSVRDLPRVVAYSDDDKRPLESIRKETHDCTRCKLCSARKQIVFGVGNPRAKLVFVGEGPGAEEDAQGVPFVGPAGQLLTKMIEAMGFTRDEVYICNVVKCRPPENRTPEIDEIESCEPFLRAQLGAIQPEVIVALGKTAVQTLLRDEASITKIRGTWHEYAGIKLMPTFHPSYLLRRPDEKKHAWSDLQQVMKHFGKEPKRS